jgi:hypothetical protein
VFAAVAAACALCFAFLYLTRPKAGELGEIRVVVTDDDGHSGNRLTVYVSEAPVVQKETVSPGTTFAGQVTFERPFRLPPHLKLTPLGKRQYDVIGVTEFGFGWTARMQPDDLRDDARKDPELIDRFLGLGLLSASAQGKLKSGLVFDDFTWEARGLPMPVSALPPKTFEQKGSFNMLIGQEGPVSFPVPYAGPPLVELSGARAHATIVTEVTATGFKWKNPMKEPFANEGTVNWTARGVLAAPK